MTRPEKVSRMIVSRNAATGVRQKNSRSRRARVRLTGKEIFTIILLLFFLMGTGIGYVWSTFEKIQIGYDLSQLKKKEMGMRETNRKLRLELALLKSPQNLESRAINDLGLRQPSPEQIVLLP